jgi:intein/homing endonuclease
MTLQVWYGVGYAPFEDCVVVSAACGGGDSVCGDSRMFYLENGNLKFGTIEEVYKSSVSGNQISVPTLRRNGLVEKPKARYPTLGDACVDFTKASVVYHGVKPVWRVTLHNGKSIEITEDHSLFSAKKSGPTYAMFPSVLKDLKNIVTVEDYGFGGKELDIPDDYLTLLGLWMADGSYIRDSACVGGIKGIAISTGNEKGILKFLEKFKFRPKSKGDYRKYSVELARFVYRLYGDVDCYSKRVPRILFTASKRQIGLFLKGYFSGDGSVHTHESDHVIVDCASVNRALLEDVQVLLNRLGIRSNIDTGYVPTRLSKRRQYKLKIEGKINVERLLKYVGLLKEFDPEFYDILKTQNSKLRHERPLSARWIRDIEYVGEKPVFDFKVNPTEIFIANGIVCHNSGSLVYV